MSERAHEAGAATQPTDPDIDLAVPAQRLEADRKSVV